MQKDLSKLKGYEKQDKIDAWKKEIREGIYYIASDTDIAYFREPTRMDVNKALAATGNDEEPLAGIMEFGRITLIGGSRAILDDDRQFLTARTILSKHYKGVALISGNL